MAARHGIRPHVCGYLHEVESKQAPDGTKRLTLVLKVNAGKDRDGKWQSGWVRVVVPKNAELPQMAKGDTIELNAWGAWNEWTTQDGQRRSEWRWMLDEVVQVTPDPRAGGQPRDDIPF